MDKPFINYHIEERSFVSYLKREIHNTVQQANFSQMRAAEIDIIVSEICTNIVKHAGSGDVLYRVENHDGNQSTFEIVAIDKGPGIVDLPRMLKDGASTTRTLGQGLGAMERLSNLFQIYSIPEWGTVIYAKVTTVPSTYVRKESFDIDFRGFCVPKPREIACGDAYRVKRTSNDIRIFLGDGLGHGQHAQEAVMLASNFFFESEESNPVDLIRQMHEKVRRSRGLVATVAILDRSRNEWRICGVGNILARLYQGITYKNYMSYNGTIGLNIPTSMSYSAFPAERNQFVVMSSDGIRTRWDLSKFPSILKYDNMIMAAAVYKDFNRGTDDSSVIVAKVS